MLPRLARWEGDLDRCIRCGYCFEHCPLYKATGWETDTPRGKLVLMQQMLAGRLAPTENLAEKLFECFHCQRCHKACSSGVNPLQIFADARADLLDLGFRPQGTLSQTDERKCALCLACLRVCPHEARSVQQVMVTDPVKCQSCGSCLDACPAGAISMRGYGTSPAELLERLRRLQPPAGRPPVATFVCSWSSYPGLLHSRLAQAGERLEAVVAACAGRISASLVLDAFLGGAWAVLLAGCRDQDCQHGGAARAERRLRRLQGYLQVLGIEPDRLELVRIGFADPAGLLEARNRLREKAEKLGPWKRAS